ncbi:nicotinamide riboside transporter PnuC [Mumia sp. Pv 4-285]|uniref:nicotinamide riboside transporter PnuC n=1 Tax=Mumia qirimensis TaxID=3234852 RepID=UPI00351CD9F2
MELFFEPAFTAWGEPFSWAEVIGAVTGVLCVWWVSREVIWNFPVGLANNVFLLVVFMDAKLYADGVLQIVFFALGVYGWTVWARGTGGGRDGDQEPVRRTTRREWVGLAVAGVLLLGASFAWLRHFTDSPVPFWDSLALALSLVATYGQARKLVESWWVWIAVDVVSVPLFLSRGLPLIALLYLVYGIICIRGLIAWRRALVRQEAPVAEVVAA